MPLSAECKTQVLECRTVFSKHNFKTQPDCECGDTTGFRTRPERNFRMQQKDGPKSGPTKLEKAALAEEAPNESPSQSGIGTSRHNISPGRLLPLIAQHVFSQQSLEAWRNRKQRRPASSSKGTRTQTQHATNMRDCVS